MICAFLVFKEGPWIVLLPRPIVRIALWKRVLYNYFKWAFYIVFHPKTWKAIPAFDFNCQWNIQLYEFWLQAVTAAVAPNQTPAQSEALARSSPVVGRQGKTCEMLRWLQKLLNLYSYIDTACYIDKVYFLLLSMLVKVSMPPQWQTCLLQTTYNSEVHGFVKTRPFPIITNYLPSLVTNAEQAPFKHCS